MRKNFSTKYFRKVKEHIANEQFESFENELFKIPEIQLEALWNFLVAGYPVNFAISNYINLFEYSSGNSIEYSTALETFYSVSFGVTAGIYLDDLNWFNSN